MGKKLITVGNVSEYICDNKIVVTADMILTPGAQDKLREERIETVYEKCCCESKECKTDEKNQDIEKKVVEILVKDFGITDPATVHKILSRLKELS